jgi:O-antigen/teichoic acid export membrane protein
MFGLVVFFGERVITLLFGPKYAPAGNVFILLFFFATLQSLSRPASAAILGNDLSRLYSLITISNVFLSVSFTMLLVPVEIMGIPTAGWGAEGAAVAKIVSGANSLLWLFIVLRKKINHQVSGRFLLPPGLVLLLVTGIFLINGGLHLQFTYSFLSLLRVFSLTAISLSAYLGLLVLLGEIQSEDIKFFRSVINPTEMKAYLVSELLE